MTLRTFMRSGIVLLFAWSFSFAQSSHFDKYFTDGTLRVDYNHGGVKTEEDFSLDEVSVQPFYAGSKINLIDTLNLGTYQARVYDAATNVLIWSHGFCSIFGEWKTTDEALQNFRRTFSETALFPMPKKPIQFIIAGRDRMNHFVELWNITINPNSRFINHARRGFGITATHWLENGDPSTHVDLAILSEGYTSQEMKKFHADADRLLKAMFSTEPYKSMKDQFNVSLVDIPSPESGVTQPRETTWVNTALGCTFNFFDLARYMLTSSNTTIQNDLAQIPYDAYIIVVNSKKYGGGGIFGLYACTSADNRASEYVFVHEFGHSFGGLGDEYYTSDVAYNDAYPKGVEPWEPNLTALLDKSNLKWKSFVAPTTPIPTPADASKYPFPTVGAFEGAGYTAKGLYRPAIDCIMLSSTQKAFDPVCESAIRTMINWISK